MDLTQIEHSGREARKAGLVEMDNPYFLAENMPRKTGDSFDEWQLKIEAWEIGWRAESSPRPRQSSSGQSGLGQSRPRV